MSRQVSVHIKYPRLLTVLCVSCVTSCLAICHLMYLYEVKGLGLHPLLGTALMMLIVLALVSSYDVLVQQRRF